MPAWTLLALACAVDEEPQDATEPLFTPAAAAEADEAGATAGWDASRPAVGTRNVQVERWGDGVVCDRWFATDWTPSSSACPDCEWAYNVRATYLDDDVDGCDGLELDENLRIAWAAGGVLYLRTDEGWEPAFFGSLGDGTIEYSGSGAWTVDGEEFDWFWYGEATNDPLSR